MYLSTQSWPSNKSVHFVHNWRCAGTSLNSVLSSNFPCHYFKLGHPFTPYGWPFPQSARPQSIESLQQIDILRKPLNSSYIIGGHSFLGLESLLPGNFDIWMNYRDPLSRLNSGIIRFYMKKRSVSYNQSNLIDSSESSGYAFLSSPEKIDHLLSTSLIRESNGICRRLSSLSLSSSCFIQRSSNIESVDILTNDSYSDSDLYEVALQNLSRVRILISSSHLHESLLAIEKIYELPSPLINPFSDLRHNPVTLTGVKYDDTTVIDNCKHILHKHSQADLRLLPHLNHIFADQINSLGISNEDLQVRRIIHKQQLLDPKLLILIDKYDYQYVVSAFAKSLHSVCCLHEELSYKILTTVLQWQPLNPQFRSDVSKLCLDTYSRASGSIS